MEADRLIPPAAVQRGGFHGQRGENFTASVAISLTSDDIIVLTKTIRITNCTPLCG